MDVELAVVIPTLNEEGAIEACLEAVGVGAGVVAVVSDGGSEDATCALAARWGARVVQGPGGRGQQLNHGAAAVDAERYLFLHADCLLPPGWRAGCDRNPWPWFRESSSVSPSLNGWFP